MTPPPQPPNMPLQGLHILVTRAKHQAPSFCRELTALGAIVFEMPLLVVAPPESWELVDQSLNTLNHYQWIIFASANAVSAFFQRAKTLGINLHNSHLQFATIGPGTAASLRQYGCEPAYEAKEHIAQGLVADFPGYPHLSGTKILWPKADIGRTYIKDALAKAGADIDPVVFYRSGTPDNMPALAQQLQRLLAERKLDVITVASGQTARNLVKLLADQPVQTIKKMLAPVHLVAIGPETAAALRSALDLDLPIHQPDSYNFAGVTNYLIAHFGGKPLPGAADCEET